MPDDLGGSDQSPLPEYDASVLRWLARCPHGASKWSLAELMAREGQTFVGTSDQTFVRRPDYYGVGEALNRLATAGLVRLGLPYAEVNANGRLWLERAVTDDPSAADPAPMRPAADAE